MYSDINCVLYSLFCPKLIFHKFSILGGALVETNISKFSLGKHHRLPQPHTGCGEPSLAVQPGVVGAPSARKRLKMDPSSQDQPDVEVYTCNIPPLVLKAGHHPRLELACPQAPLIRKY